MYTAVSSGSVPTQYFGEEFDADKVETNLQYTVYVKTPASVRNNPNVTLHLDVEKVFMTDLSSGEDTLYVAWTRVETSHYSYNYTAPIRSYYWIKLKTSICSNIIHVPYNDLLPYCQSN